jgi:PKD repeat protein
VEKGGAIMNKRKIMMLLMACFMLISVSSPAMAAGGLTAVRSFSSSVVSPGDTFRVSVELNAYSSVTAPAIDEELPPAWTVSVVDKAGSTYKSSTEEWFFLASLNSGDHRTIIYDVTVPSDTPEGTYTISGTYSSNTISPSSTLGDKDIVVSSTPSDPVVAPDADFSANVVSGIFPLTVQFTDISTGTPTGWEWDFNNDGTVDCTDQNPEHTFTSAANYDVKLNVMNSAGSDSLTKTDYIMVSDPNDNPGDNPDEGGSDAKSTSSAVSLGAEIVPAVGIVVTPGTINFGLLGAGEVSDVRTVQINNRGSDSTIITADVVDAADDLFIDGLYIDSGMWNEYSALLVSKEMNTADLTLHVPSDYSNIGSMKGILVIWAEIE